MFRDPRSGGEGCACDACGRLAVPAIVIAPGPGQGTYCTSCGTPMESLRRAFDTLGRWG